MAKFVIGNYVTCKVGDIVFNGDVIGVRKETPQYIIRDYAIGRTIPIGEKEIKSHNVPAKYSGTFDWRFLDEGFVSVYDGVTRSPPVKQIEDNIFKKLPCANCLKETKLLMNKLNNLKF